MPKLILSIFIISPLEQFYVWPTPFFGLPNYFFFCFIFFCFLSYLYCAYYHENGHTVSINYIPTKISFKTNFKYFIRIYIPLIVFCLLFKGSPICGLLLCGLFVGFIGISSNMNIEICLLYNTYLLKKLIAFIRNIFINNLQINNNIFMVIFILIFFYLAFVNVTGMFPYAVTFTGHLTFTFFVSFSYFIGLNLVAFSYQKNNYFNLFLPSGVPVFIIPLIIFIEFMSFFMRMLSLSIRLFANMMAGHTLLKILTVFAYILFYYITIFGEMIGISLAILVIIFIIALEIFIAFLQAYVFVTLMILYLNDILHIH